MALNTYKIFLMYKDQKSGTTYQKLEDIKDYPDMFGEPEMLETTTMSHGSQTFIPGIKKNANMTFTMNLYDGIFEKLQSLEGVEIDYSLWCGGTENADGTVTPTGDVYKIDFSGRGSIGMPGKGVNEVQDITWNIATTVPAHLHKES